MYKIISINKAKSLLFFFLLSITVTNTFAQDNGSFKYIPFGKPATSLLSRCAIEADKKYYLTTCILPHAIYRGMLTTITVFDEFLHTLKTIDLYTNLQEPVAPFQLFYEEPFFYAIGITGKFGGQPFFAKYDKDFNPLHPPIVYYKDTMEYICHDVVVNSEGEFVCFLTSYGTFEVSPNTRLMRISKTGELLEDVYFPSPRHSLASIVEIGNNYFIDVEAANFLLRCSKDSLGKFDTLYYTPHEDDYKSEGLMVSVGNNRLIRTGTSLMFHDECGNGGLPPLEFDRFITFLDTNMNVINRLNVGMPCALDVDGAWNMDYINPDSIYYVSEVYIGGLGHATINIANFSQDGHLNFNHTLDIGDTTGKTIFGCKALSDGGVLVFGDTRKFTTDGDDAFVLKYHPTKQLLTIKEFAVGEEIQVYPNPVQTQFMVTNTANATIYLYNILGQEIKQVVGKEENTTIHTENLPAGVYILKVVKEKGVVTKKVQIVR